MTQTSHRPGPDPAAEQGDGTVLLTSAEREVLAPACDALRSRAAHLAEAVAAQLLDGGDLGYGLDEPGRAAELRAQSERITEAMAAAAVTVENPHVRLTVDATGAVTELVFLDAATSVAPTQLAASVKELYLDAEARAALRTREAMAAAGAAGVVESAVPAEVADRIEQQEGPR